ncbi:MULTISPECIES: DEAD/DEAH box helicase [Streptomycetaceae]|uniref:Putative ATP-dependent RNA helicase n=1 Tax=Streptantibioticus cattleyicolor (strain ATCC 35852 / DSM 46488 / JCM 4925 / NBRC 14057 / NRRL 8057) TaxID=1003195 RepID=G8WQX0_STREN|nr:MULTISPECIES: DEAD/DEAH box helicase [Streptomycetaceae]AEW95728.1 putative ATP-dependent RNA helicase [Streptantibioticus cattleyicolor NRRL 8057 = DSM 46488]MYS60274.1 DEAD/DEAH box helicase [Streptomyces sp. SID5468]
MAFDIADRSGLPVTDETTDVTTDVTVVTDETTAPVTDDTTTGGNGEAPEAPAADTVTFADLGLAEQVVRKLAQNGVTTPFPIQAATIPDALAGKDILGRGRTGSGKTLSFGLPLLTTLAGGRTEAKRPRGVILTPTRELAMQVSDALQPYGDVLGLKLKVVCGGTSMSNQIYALERGVDILVATPGRLRDLIDRGACALDAVKIAVLDEADQMADMGFLPEVTEILDLIPPGGQRLLFSATLENEIDTLVKRYLVDPVTHEVDPSAGAVTTMTHHVLVVKPKDKAPVTAAIAARKGRTIIFVRTQMGADRVAQQLVEAGVRADALHGGMTQGARTRTLADFKDGYVNVLVATDVAARGIHVDGIDLVLNVDPAGDHKDYLHRSGRTARAGRSGTVVSLALPHQRKQIFRLMEDAGVEASRHVVGGAGAFDEDVARITGARSLTEVQADAAVNAAQQAEREVVQLTRELERVQRQAAELREEADRLTARAARERGEVPQDAPAAPVAQAADEAPAAVTEPVSAEAATVAAPAAAPSRTTDEPRERGSYERRPERRPYDRDRRDDRRPFDRDRRDDRRPFDRDRRDDRPSFSRDRDRDRRDDRRDDRRPFDRDRRDDRRPFDRDRRDDRPSFNRDRDRDRRDDRRDDRRPFDRERRDDRPSFNRDRREHRGSDRPFNRDRRDERPAFGRDRDADRRPYGRRDDHRGGSSFGPGSRGHDRRADKPRWKRNG